MASTSSAHVDDPGSELDEGQAEDSSTGARGGTDGLCIRAACASAAAFLYEDCEELGRMVDGWPNLSPEHRAEILRVAGGAS